jgi:phosphoglycerol transferase MdoB-like AlkP superfamily enzyme
MTFEGKNFDIVFGISTLLILTLGLYKGSVMRIKILLIWNLIGLLFLGNIVFYALFSSPSSFQKFAFDQPNIAVLRFPFPWLPTFIVPLVLFAHLAVIRRVLFLKNKLSLT